MFNEYDEPIRTTVVMEGHTDTVEVVVNGKRVTLMKFDERTSLFGDLLVHSIEKAVEGCKAMCDNERLNTVTEYRNGNFWSNFE